jgi:dUTP pyrophosphatase
MKFVVYHIYRICCLRIRTHRAVDGMDSYCSGIPEHPTRRGRRGLFRIGAHEPQLRAGRSGPIRKGPWRREEWLEEHRETRRKRGGRVLKETAYLPYRGVINLMGRIYQLYEHTMSIPTITIELENPSQTAECYANYKPSTASGYRDSGFDLYMPADVTIPGGALGFMIDLGVRCEYNRSSGYYLYPRSSISKTPIRLANSVGIIDNGYRGTLKVAVDNRSADPVHVKRGDRLFQLCIPSLEAFKVVFGPVNRLTERGEGGFGSTNV